MDVGGFTIVDSIQDINVRKWQAFNKHYMIYKEVGGDFSAYDVHHAKINQLVSNDMKHEALIELANMRQGVYNAMNEYSPEVEAFRQLVIGSDKGIEDLSIKLIKDSIEEVKKK